MKKIFSSPTMIIFIAMFLGAVVGFLANHFGYQTIIQYWIAPLGTLFLNTLKFIAIPLIIFSLLSGFTSLPHLASLQKLAKKTVLAYLFTTIIAASLGLLLVNLIRPGLWMKSDTRDQLVEQAKMQAVTASEKSESYLQFIVDLIPNINANMLSIIVISILFALAVVSIQETKRQLLADLFDAINETIMKLIDFVIIYLAPVGVFALIANIACQVTSFDLVIALLSYGCTVILGLGILVFGFYPMLVSKLAHIPYFKFLRTILPAQILAISTSSSAATLPLTMECGEHLGIKKETIYFVLPIGATLNMDGSSLYISVATLFAAQIFEIDITLLDQLVIILMATASSIGSAAIPSGSIVMLSAVFVTLGIPSEGLVLILALDRPLDMLRTATNVTSDLAIAAIIGKMNP